MSDRIQTYCRGVVVLLLFVSMQGSLLTGGLFVLHHGHVAEHLCINRHNPDVECNGFCFLADRLSDVHDAHGSHAALHVPRVTQELASTMPCVPAPSVTHTDQPLLSPYVVSSGRLFSDDVFRPPQSESARSTLDFGWDDAPLSEA